MAPAPPDELADPTDTADTAAADPGATPDAADWHRRVVARSLRAATQRSIDRGSTLIRAAAALLERSGGDGFTVQDVADETGQSLRTLYQYFESKDDLLLAVFEEAMHTYAHMVRHAIAGLDEPGDRLAGALLAAARMPEFTGTGVNGGLARLRLKLTEVDPELVGRSQAPVAGLFRELVEAAAGAGRIAPRDPEAATFLLLSLNAAAITSDTLGNDVGAPTPAVADLVTFCLQGLGAAVEPGWLDAVGARLRLPAGRISLAPRPAASA
jgi:AcrR family transcriptional regulator